MNIISLFVPDYTVIIIQARLTSTRFPRKVLADLCGKTVIDRVILAAKQSINANKVILATPHYIPTSIKIDKFIGDENDVLDRYYKCAKKYGAKIIVRITADCPLMDSYIIDKTIGFLKKNKEYDFVTSRPFCPDGLDVEVFTFKCLERAHKEATDSFDREHVTSYMLKSNWCKKHNLKGFWVNIPSGKYSIDTKADLERIKKFFNGIEG